MTCFSVRLFITVFGACVLSIASPSIGSAQQRVPPSGVTRRAPMAAPLVNDTVARTSYVASTAFTLTQDSVMQQRTHRVRHALIGGVIGSVAVVGACYYLLGTNSDNGDSTRCRPLGAVISAGSGFGIGALIGALIP